MSGSSRGWWILAVLSAVGIHVVAAASLVLPALPVSRRHPALTQAMPPLRAILLAAGVLAVAALAVALARRGRPRARGAVTLAILAVALAAGTQYGGASAAHVRARPVAVREEQGRPVFDHARLDAVLGRFVDADGMVDYRGLANDRADLDEYVGQLATASPRSAPALFPTEAHRVAYWINAYNALILRAVVDHYPIGSVSDVMVAHGVFNRLTFPVGGDPMTLDDIEKGILLGEVHDPRVHFALTCASMSCPRLDQRAFRAAGLSARLDAEGRDFLRSPDGVRFDRATGTARLSSYFKWYAGDFGDAIGFVRPYLEASTAGELAAPRIEFLPYDWRLNDAGAPWRARRASQP